MKTRGELRKLADHMVQYFCYIPATGVANAINFLQGPTGIRRNPSRRNTLGDKEWRDLLGADLPIQDDATHSENVDFWWTVTLTPVDVMLGRMVGNLKRTALKAKNIKLFQF